MAGIADPAQGYARLMACARFPNDLRTMAVAGCLSQSLRQGHGPLVRGLSELRFGRMLRSCFDGVDLVNTAGAPDAVDNFDAFDEFDDLLALLLDYRAEASELNAWIAHCVATASLRDRHLWQDLGLPSRAALSRLLAATFPALAAQNVDDMKWKKFFYRQLCRRAGLNLCKSPNCRDCTDYAACFGPELAMGTGLRPAAVSVVHG